ncbi:MAG: flagellar hook-associated protein FlgK [Candidatus Dactylopiibacterium sp.]|nr:flagellar hook-associated protein FlgK [Candidatus Dactylopiibacterium sp.]
MAGLLNISLSGLNAAQAALNTTSHNIANATVAGYNRQQVVQSANTPMFSGVGFFGQGTQIDTVKRIYNQFLSAQVLAADSARAEYETYYNQIKQIDNLLGNTTSGLNTSLDSFFEGVQQVAADPSSIPSRQSMLSSSEALVNRFRALQTRFQEVRDGVESQISQTVDQVNSLARKVAELNQKIVIAQSSGTNVIPNDLLDARDTAVADLNKLIKVTTSTNGDGSFNVFIGSGQPLVMNSDVFTLSTKPSDSDPERLAIGVQLPSGGNVAIPESLLTGGSLGGLLRYRSESLDPAQNALGRLALGLVTRFNAQHSLGQDLAGNMGGAYFNTIRPTTQNLQNLVTGAPSTASVSATVTSVGALTTSDYLLSYDGTNYTLKRAGDGATLYTGTSMPGHSVTQTSGTSGATFSLTATAGATGMAEDYALSYDGTNYTIKSAASGKTLYTGGLPATIEGIRIELTGGTPAAGDSFSLKPGLEGLSFSGTMAAGDRVLIQPTRNAARDISLAINDTSMIAAGSPVRSVAATTNTGTGSLTQPTALSLAGLQGAGGAHLATPVTLRFDAANNQFVITGATPGTIPYTPASDSSGSTITLSSPNISFSISGRPANGDTFTIENNVGGTKDGRNANALYALSSAKDLLGGTATLGYAYSQMVSSVGTQTASAKLNQASQQVLYEQALAEQQNLSGVNLDEEAANLLRFQQAYQACARAIGIAGTLFDDILGIMR